jgi:hypothetical protein
MESNITLVHHDDITRHDALRRDTSRHTLTIKQTAELFAKHGAPRSPRSIQRFCDQENIDCIRVKGDKTERYFVDPVSVERYAQELKQLENISHIGAEVTRHDASQHDTSRHDATPDSVAPNVTKHTHDTADESVELLSRIDVLDKENLQLKIDRAAKEQFIGQMLDDRRAWLAQLTEQSREIGRLEMEVQQLAAPSRDMTRHDATDIITDAATFVEQVPMTIDTETALATASLPTHAEPTKRSVWRRIFR